MSGERFADQIFPSQHTKGMVSAMQLHVTLKSRGESLPISYQALIHGWIYHLLQENEHTTDLHNAANQSRVYKGFTFGRLNGSYTVQERRITFADTVQLEIRSIHEKLIRTLSDGLRSQQQIRLGSAAFDVLSVKEEDVHLHTERAEIIMSSPVVAYITQEQKKTVYLSPDDPRFFSLLIRNAERKWHQFFGDTPFELTVKPCFEHLPPKVFTHFKQTYITGWTGRYLLEGTPEAIDMLYQAGLGAKNPEGFGMFDVPVKP